MFADASAALSRSLGGDGDSERGVKRVSSSRFLAIRGERFGSTGVDGGDGTEGSGDDGDGARRRERTLVVGDDMNGGKLELIGGSRIMTNNVHSQFDMSIVDIRQVKMKMESRKVRANAHLKIC